MNDDLTCAHSLVYMLGIQLGEGWATCAEQQLICLRDLSHGEAGDGVSVLYQVHSCGRLWVPQPNAAVIVTCNSRDYTEEEQPHQSLHRHPPDYDWKHEI